MKKDFLVVLGTLLFAFFFTTNALATTFTYADTSKGVNFVLDLTPINDANYGATFTITGPESSGWYLGWVTFQAAGKISDLKLNDLTTTEWDVGDSDTKVPTGNTLSPLLQNVSWVGICDKDLSLTKPGIGLLLDGSADYTFTFNLTVAGLSDTDIPFQVGYYGGLVGNNNGQSVNSDQLSADLIDPPPPVPEPETMLLLGAGLIGLSGVGRRKFFKR